MAPGDYCRMADGRLHGRVPSGEVVTTCPLRVSVRWEADGSASVWPAIRTTDWTWRLERGVWR